MLMLFAVLSAASFVSATSQADADVVSSANTQNSIYNEAISTTDSTEEEVVALNDSACKNKTDLVKSNKTIKQASKHSTKLVVSNKTVYLGKNVELTATVVDKTTNKYANGGTVVFKVNGISVGSATLKDGKAYYIYNTTNLTVKRYTVSAVYSGSGIYSSSRYTGGYLKIVLLPTKISLTIPSAYSTSTLIKATVVDKVNNKYIKSGTIVFKLNGETIGKSTIVNGKASLNYSLRNYYAGSYTISAVYGATKTYSAYRANKTLKVVAQSSFSLSDIKSTAVALRTKYESNNIINSVYISKTKLHVQDFLYLMVQATKTIYNSKSSNISYKHFSAATSQSDTIKEGTLYKSELISIANKVISYMNTNNKAPSYISTSRGNLGYYNIIYTFTKILDVSSLTYVVDSSSVYNWKVLHPSDSTKRPIYISSDNIFSTSKDTAFLNTIKSALQKKGYTVYIIGVGPNTHSSEIWDESLPINAVQLSIFGGADAGVIRDVTTRSFMRIKANRMLFFVYHSDSSSDITNLKWLARSSDDNYSPSSFTGISYPAKVLLNNGYDYAYTNSVNTIVKELIEYIS